MSNNLASSSSSSRNCSYGYANIEKQRQRLPVYKYRTEILYLVENHATTIIVGETGSGKTTQIPQYLKEAGWAEGGRVIACTQPRRLAVQAVSARVAEEMGVNLGEEVGYTIRFEDHTTSGVTSVKFLTDGVLIREMMEDPLLTKYSVIMIDEAHERSISTDILLGLLKKIQRRRPELRLIISSATIEAKTMSNFFNSSKKRHAPEGSTPGPKLEPAILSVEGRGFSVKIHYVEEPVSDYIRSVVSTILLINEREPPGDVLVFLTGQEDIETAIKLLEEEAHSNQKNSSGLLPLPLYSGLSRSEQELIFTPTPRGKRKVILSTNIAETSLTLEARILLYCLLLQNPMERTDGVVYVIDSGFSKQKFYNPISDIESLVVAPISKASARQRSGRAGRVRPGKCYRLYTEDYFLNQMPGEGIPEMQRSNLVSTVIQLKALGIDNILGFDWPAPPSSEAMIRALEVLYSLQILDDDAKLTSPTGFQVAELPLDPMISKMILASSELGCSHEIITIAAVLSVQVKALYPFFLCLKFLLFIYIRNNRTYCKFVIICFRLELWDLKLNRCNLEYVSMQSVWIIARGVQKEQDEAKLRFAAAEGDHVTFLNVYKGFLESKKPTQWCYKNFLNYQSMAVRKAVTAGFFANACRLEPHSNGVYKTIRGSEEVYIHPSSVLFRVNPKWVVYQSIVSTERQYMRNVVTINPSWLTEVAPHFYQNRQNAMSF
ncbi:putative pre-mRNA-splicing factor ATP-dependent RNA helicase DEAH9 [Arabidopsis thaliana]